VTLPPPPTDQPTTTAPLCAILIGETLLTDVIEIIEQTSPRYAALLRKDSHLATQLDELIPRGRALTQEKNKNNVPTWSGEVPRHKPAPKLRHSGAEALLQGLLPEQTTEELDPPMPPEVWHGAAEHREIGAKIEALTEARKLLLPEIAKARREYSKQAAEQHAKAYKAVVAAVVKNAKALGDAILAHAEFINDMRLAGVERKHLRPINLQAFGDLGGGTPLFDLLTHAIETGHADEKQRPDWKLPASLELLSII
jgi:hypothetical protein